MLARAAGLPSRLAIGYLPGRYDPFSGTHRVRQGDLHAWAEIYFERNGWVAFDSAPRPELERFLAGDFSAFSGGVYIFQTRVGGGLYEMALAGGSSTYRAIQAAFEGKAKYIWPSLAGVGGAAIIALTIWLLIRRKQRQLADPLHYSKLPGPARFELQRLIAKLERSLKSVTTVPRKPSQTTSEYLRTTAQNHSSLREQLTWFGQASQASAYDPNELDEKVLKEAYQRFLMFEKEIKPLKGIS